MTLKMGDEIIVPAAATSERSGQFKLEVKGYYTRIGAEALLRRAQ